MAKQEVTGITESEIEELRKEFNEKNESEWYDLEERYCLFGIPYQPEDYNGETRYCARRANSNKGGLWRCPSHKDRGVPNPENLTPGSPTHYMYATDEYLLEHLTDEEREVYENILQWADIYGIDEDEDPAVYDDLKLLALQRVRSIKASKYLLEEGEIQKSVLRDAEGQIIIDKNGEPKTEDDTNAASEEYRRLITLIKELKKELGLTRKEQLKADDRNVAAESVEVASGAMKELVNDDEKEFNADDYD